MTDAQPEPADQGGALTEAERQQIIDTGRHVYGCCGADCPDHGLPEDAQIRLVERIVAARLADERERIAQAIEAELVCCDGEDRHGGGICYWGSRAARIARDGGDR